MKSPRVNKFTTGTDKQSYDSSIYNDRETVANKYGDNTCARGESFKNPKNVGKIMQIRQLRDADSTLHRFWVSVGSFWDTYSSKNHTRSMIEIRLKSYEMIVSHPNRPLTANILAYLTRDHWISFRESCTTIRRIRVRKEPRGALSSVGLSLLLGPQLGRLAARWRAKRVVSVMDLPVSACVECTHVWRCRTSNCRVRGRDSVSVFLVFLTNPTRSAMMLSSFYVVRLFVRSKGNEFELCATNTIRLRMFRFHHSI